MVGLAIGRRAPDVGDDRRDPHGGEAHLLDIVELVDEGRVRAAAVLAVVDVAGGRHVRRPGKAVGDDLRASGRASRQVTTKQSDGGSSGRRR